MPSLGTKNSEHDEVNAISKTSLINNYPMSNIRKLCDNEFSIYINSDNKKLFVSRFMRDNHCIYFIINDSEIEINITAKLRKPELVEIYNPMNGEIKEVSLPLTEKIGDYQSIFLVERMKDMIMSE